MIKGKGNKRSLGPVSPANIQKKIKFTTPNVCHLSVDKENFPIDFKLQKGLEDKIKTLEALVKYKDEIIRRKDEQVKVEENKNLEFQEKLAKAEDKPNVDQPAKTVDSFDVTKIMEDLEQENISLKNVSNF